ncbi:MAG: DinB family protein [Candidatus Dormibacteria bacterium]
MGYGTYTLDPVSGPEPTLGNIAWRMAHLSSALSSHPVAAVVFGPDWPAPDLARPAGTAAQGLDRLDRAWTHWLEAVAALPEGDFARPLGPVPDHVHEADKTVSIPRHNPAEAVVGDEYLPVPLCLVEDAGVERFCMKLVDLAVVEFPSPQERDRHWRKYIDPFGADGAPAWPRP